MNKNNWLGYEVDDDVWVFNARYGNYDVRGPFKVTKVTPTGRVTLSNKEQYLNSGRLVGSDSWGTTFVARKDKQKELKDAYQASARVKALERQLRTFREELPLSLATKEERDAVAGALLDMSRTIRLFDNRIPV